MKNKFILICAILLSVQTMAQPSLVVKPLNGKECITALGFIGKLSYSKDSLYLYDKTNTLIFSDLRRNIQHVRFSIEQDSVTNIDNVLSEDVMQIKIFPNPTQNILYIENVSTDILRLYSMDGNLLQSTQIQHGNAQINIEHLPTGNYLLLCGKQAFQIIKQ